MPYYNHATHPYKVNGHIYSERFSLKEIGIIKTAEKNREWLATATNYLIKSSVTTVKTAYCFDPAYWVKKQPDKSFESLRALAPAKKNTTKQNILWTIHTELFL